MKNVVEKFDALYDEAFLLSNSGLIGIRSIEIIISLMEEYLCEMIKKEYIPYSEIKTYTEKLMKVEDLMRELRILENQAHRV